MNYQPQHLPSSSQSTYIFDLSDQESSEEVARLMTLDQVTTKAMGGPLAGLPALPENANVIDLACGPGGWVLDVASARSDVQVCGIDINKAIVDEANARAQMQKRLNASYSIMDISQPLDFADHSFDLVNGRYLVSVLPTENWTEFLQECRRITRPSDIFRLIDSEYVGLTKSPAWEKTGRLMCQLLHATGHSFSSDGHTIGITPVVARLLRQAGFQQIQQSIHMINFSAGTEAWIVFSLNVEILFTQGARMAEKFGPAAEQYPDALLRQALMEMQREDFCGIFWFISTWGINPPA